MNPIEYFDYILKPVIVLIKVHFDSLFSFFFKQCGGGNKKNKGKLLNGQIVQEMPS